MQIFNIYANLQYLCKSSIFIYICAYICLPLSGLCTSRIYLDFRSQRDYFVGNIISLAFIRIFVFLSLVCVQVDLCLTSGVRERESYHICLHFSYFCNLFKSFVNLAFICIFRIFVIYLNY